MTTQNQNAFTTASKHLRGPCVASTWNHNQTLRLQGRNHDPHLSLNLCPVSSQPGSGGRPVLSQTSRHFVHGGEKRLQLPIPCDLPSEGPIGLLPQPRAPLQLPVVRGPAHRARQAAHVKGQSAPQLPDPLLHPAHRVPALQEAAEGALQTGPAV